MELLQQHEHHHKSNRGQVELAVYDLVGQFLAISLEKYDMEVIVESNDFLCDQENRLELDGILNATIDFEEIIETDDAIEISISGIIGKGSGRQETFVLFFLLSLVNEANSSLKQCHWNRFGTNCLWLQFSRKAEQLSDPVFKVNLYKKAVNGQLYDLGSGRGFLVFGREKTTKMN